MSQYRWTRIRPEEPCISPDGHEPMDVYSAESEWPIRSACSRCGLDYHIVVLPEAS